MRKSNVMRALFQKVLATMNAILHNSKSVKGFVCVSDFDVEWRVKYCLKIILEIHNIICILIQE